MMSVVVMMVIPVVVFTQILSFLLVVSKTLDLDDFICAGKVCLCCQRCLPPNIFPTIVGFFILYI